MGTMVCFPAYHIEPALGGDLHWERLCLVWLDLSVPIVDAGASLIGGSFDAEIMVEPPLT